MNWIDPSGLSSAIAIPVPRPKDFQIPGWCSFAAARLVGIIGLAGTISGSVPQCNENNEPPGCREKDPCDEIMRQIRAIQNELAKRERQLASDKYGLFNRAYSDNPGGDLAGKGTYLGHVAVIEGLKIGLAKKIAEAKAKGCL